MSDMTKSQKKHLRQLVGQCYEKEMTLTLESLYKEFRKWENIGSKEGISADITTPAEELMEMMLERNFSMVPITKNNKLPGIVDICSLVELRMTPVAERYFR